MSVENPKDAAARHRLDLSLAPDTASAYMALGFTEGDCKYGGYNWREAGVKASVYYAAAKRHMADWFNGQWADPATEVPHLASALACIGIIVDAIECDKLIDDRPPAMDMKDVLDNLAGIVASLHQAYPNGPGRYTQEAKERGEYAK